MPAKRDLINGKGAILFGYRTPGNGRIRQVQDGYIDLGERCLVIRMNYRTFNGSGLGFKCGESAEGSDQKTIKKKAW